MARISSGSPEGAGAADRFRPSERGTSRCVPSELKSGSLCVRRTLRRGDALGVIESEEWMSPRRFLSALGPTAGALGVLIRKSIAGKVESMCVYFEFRAGSITPLTGDLIPAFTKLNKSGLMSAITDQECSICGCLAQETQIIQQWY